MNKQFDWGATTVIVVCSMLLGIFIGFNIVPQQQLKFINKEHWCPICGANTNNIMGSWVKQ